MANRTTFFQVRNSRLPQSVGLCAADGPSIASIVNEAQVRLIQAGGETGWYGTWAKMVFNISKTDPYITAPREVARLINIDLCRAPIKVQNEFYEFLEFGGGLQSPAALCSTVRCSCEGMQAYDRSNYPTARDITAGNKLRIFMGNAADNGKRIFFQAKDTNDMPIYTMDNGVQVNGFFLTLDNLFPFVESPMHLNSIQGVQKDTTVGPVFVYQVDANDNQSLLSTYAPNEQVGNYRRYFLSNLPTQCFECDSPPNLVQITAMAKLEFVPVSADTDYLLIGNIPALKEECMAIRYGEMDTVQAQGMAATKHREAIRLLNRELIHYEGKERPALQFKPFGNADLEQLNIGMM